MAALAEQANVPVFTRRMGRSALAADHPLHFGMAWFSMNGVSLAAASECDLLLLVGGHLHYDLEHGRAPYLNGKARIVQIDASPAEIGQNRAADVAIVGDARLVLEQLRAALPAPAPSGGTRQAWVDRLRAARAEVEEQLAPLRRTEGSPIHPIRLWSEVEPLLDERTTIVTGQGDSDFWAELLVPPRAPGRYARSGRAGCLGTEIAYGIAAKLALPRRRRPGDGRRRRLRVQRDGAGDGRPLRRPDRGDRLERQRLGDDQGAADGLAGAGRGHPSPSLGRSITRSWRSRSAATASASRRRSRSGRRLRRAFAVGRPAVLDVQIASFTSPLIRWLCRTLPNPHPLIGYPADTPRYAPDAGLGGDQLGGPHPDPERVQDRRPDVV